ncbi:DUF393 domain-containing protein, partial [Alcaligenes faecalis subsp. faecalis]|uniref:thiol-disulfide oxidoreductase DCC family protein n=1 Tax=Alcaligenes faecalis TaxID=511 RepID=UPI001F222BCE
FSSLQSNYAKQTLLQYGIDENRILDGIVFLEGSNIYYKSKAVFLIAQLLGFPFSIMSVFRYLPAVITDFIYDFISTNRYKWFG